MKKNYTKMKKKYGDRSENKPSTGKTPKTSNKQKSALVTMNFMYHHNTVNSTKLPRRVLFLIITAALTGIILYHYQEEASYFFIPEFKNNLTKLWGHLQPPYKVNCSDKHITKTNTTDMKIIYKKRCYVSTSLSRYTPNGEEKFTDVLFANVTKEMKYLGFDEYGNCDGERRIAAPSVPTIISAVSRNHYSELAALCKNMNATLRRKFHKIVFIVYNLETFQNNNKYVKSYNFETSLNYTNVTKSYNAETSQNSDVKALAHYCGCEIRDFPFSRFPKHVRLLTGYTWKPLVISMALREFPFVMWLDASIRFNPRQNISRLWDRARHWHIQMLSAPCCSVAEVTDIPTMRFLRQNETEYMQITGIGAGFGIFLRTKLLMERVIRPWVLCAMSYGCMLTDTYKRQIPCYKQKPMKAGICHRFEQAVLAIILSKLYGKNYEQLLLKEREFGRVARGNTVRYRPKSNRKKLKENAYRLRGSSYGANEQFPKVIEDRRRELYPNMRKLKGSNGTKNVKLVRGKLYVNGHPSDTNLHGFHTQAHSEREPERQTRRNLQMSGSQERSAHHQSPGPLGHV